MMIHKRGNGAENTQILPSALSFADFLGGSRPSAAACDRGLPRCDMGYTQWNFCRFSIEPEKSTIGKPKHFPNLKCFFGIETCQTYKKSQLMGEHGQRMQDLKKKGAPQLYGSSSKHSPPAAVNPFSDVIQTLPFCVKLWNLTCGIFSTVENNLRTGGTRYPCICFVYLSIFLSTYK